jgi:phosphohistidine phosphatase
MKTILFLRHAKSDWSDPGQPDLDRPLTKRGLDDAPGIGQMLARFECVPDIILSSPALRARQTAELAAKACGYEGSLHWEDSFYGGSSHALITALQRLPDTLERPLVVGHNPTLEETVSVLLIRGEGGWQEDSVIRIPTSGLVCLDVDVAAWANLEPGKGTLQWFVIPKLVRAMR